MHIERKTELPISWISFIPNHVYLNLFIVNYQVTLYHQQDSFIYELNILQTFWISIPSTWLNVVFLYGEAPAMAREYGCWETSGCLLLCCLCRFCGVLACWASLPYRTGASLGSKSCVLQPQAPYFLQFMPLVLRGKGGNGGRPLSAGQPLKEVLLKLLHL